MFPFRPYRRLTPTCVILLAAACFEGPAPIEPEAEPSVPVRASLDAVPVSYQEVRTGYSSTCGLGIDGRISCWGGGGWGEEKAPLRAGFTQVATNRLYVGVTCGVRANGTLTCWGDNSFFQAPGGALSPENPYAQVATSGYHTCTVRSDRSLFCFGDDSYGNVSLAPTERAFTEVSANAFGTCALRTDGVIRCWGDGQQTHVAKQGVFVRVSAGTYHSCGLRDDGGIECWGSNVFGQLDVPPGRYVDVDAGEYHVCAVRRSGAVVCWGDRNTTERPPSGRDFVQVSTGGFHNCALRSSGAVVCWGAPEFIPPSGGVSALAFSGFLGGLKDAPAWNRVRAGSAVTLAFTLRREAGMQLVAPGYPQVAPLSCGTSANPMIGLPVKAPAGRLLRYDASTKVYSTEWTTEPSWAGSCRQLILELVDGSIHRANFQFH